MAYKVLDQYYAANNLKVEPKDKSEAMSYASYNPWKSKSEKELYEEIYKHYFGTNDQEAIKQPENAQKKELFSGEYQRASRNLLGLNKGSFMDEEFWKKQNYEGSGDFYFKNEFE